MKIRAVLKGDLGSMLVKNLTATALGGLFGTHEADSSPTSAASSAWKEIESKLHGLFGTEDVKKHEDREGKHFMKVLAIIAVLVVIAYLLGRRQGRGRATVLEVHKA